jgi:hypothetical protein
MKLTIPIEIDCGETTCASEPGKFCHLFASDMQGNGVCYLYVKKLNTHFLPVVVNLSASIRTTGNTHSSGTLIVSANN